MLQNFSVDLMEIMNQKEDNAIKQKEGKIVIKSLKITIGVILIVCVSIFIYSLSNGGLFSGYVQEFGEDGNSILYSTVTIIPFIFGIVLIIEGLKN